MFLPLKKIFFAFTFNFTLFLMLMIGIQNSSKRTKVDFLVAETVRVPISFVIGISFISGSLLGTFINVNKKNKEINF